MIIKSMSRKVPSFGQLLGYIDRDEGQEAYRIRHNLLSRDPARIRAEFEGNGDLLQRRKNGVYLYHEIISITRAKGLSPEAQKERLYEIAQSYIAARCSDNLVFGGLHQDKEHSYHYHLMISANRAGETGRFRLSKAQFREIQVGLENHVLQKFPELEQKVAIGKRSDRKLSRSENELERRTGSRPKREDVLQRVRDAFATASDRDSLLEALGRNDLELYVRGKNLGVIDHESGKNHRLKTLDAEMSDRIEGLMMEGLRTEKKIASEGEKEKAPNHETEAQDQKPNHDRKTDSRPKEPDMSREQQKDEPIPPNEKRREQIDKGHVIPDPERDKLTHEEWRTKDSFATKVQQSWRWTMDDFRGRSKDQTERDQGKDNDDRDRER